jgi:Zn-finger nucleic acid-binding protein
MRVLRCPRCDEPMAVQAIRVGEAPAAIDVCAMGCGGIWLDDADLRAGVRVSDDLTGVSIKPTCTPDTAQPVPCPVCARTMQRYQWNYTSTVQLDQCPENHGTWIDHGEVQAMKAFMQSEAPLPYATKQQSWSPQRELRELAGDAVWDVGGWCVWELLESVVEQFGSSN